MTCGSSAVGPLTNIALALRTAPDLAGKLGGVSIMGGSVGFGNVTPVAEFNIWADPEAADIVFRSGAPLIMCGLNVTHQWMIDKETVHRIREVGGDAATFVADMLTYYGQAYGKKFSGRAEGPLHDPCAVLALSHPELLEFGVRHVSVECAGRAHARHDGGRRARRQGERGRQRESRLQDRRRGRVQASLRGAFRPARGSMSVRRLP